MQDVDGRRGYCEGRAVDVWRRRERKGARKVVGREEKEERERER